MTRRHPSHRVVSVLLSALIGAAACGSWFVAACGRAEAPAPTSAPTTSTAPATASAPAWHRPRSDERRDERRAMVRRQIASPRDGRIAVRDERVLEAMREVPRHLFVPSALANDAYTDRPLPIGHGQTISQPYIVALMTEALQLKPGDKVFEVGTGSGYQAAVLAELTPHVYTVEIVEPLAEGTIKLFERLGYSTIRARAGDGYEGWPEAAPFDAMIVTCAASKVPEPLWQQLKPGGRIVIPVGEAGWTQQLTIVSKTADGQRRDEGIIPCVFVPMTGKIQQERD